MAVALRAATSANASLPGSGSISFSYTSGSGSDRLLLVQTRIGGGSVSSVSYAGAALTNAGSAGGMVMWRKTAPATGANNITITGSTYQACVYTASDWTGVDQTTPLGTQVTATGTSSGPSTASITCPAGGMVGGGMWAGYATAPGTITVFGTTSMTSWSRESANGYRKADGYRSNTGALQWTQSPSTAWEAQGFPINPAVSFTAKLPKVYSQAIQGSVI